LTKDSTHFEALTIFEKMGEINKAASLPVIDDDFNLIGSVKNDHLIEYLEAVKEERRIKDKGKWKALNNFFD